jgi:Uma2 family endonuclease
MPKLARAVTADDLYSMCRDGKRRELIRGSIVEMAPAGAEHGALSMGLGAKLYNFVCLKKLGLVFAAETGFILERDPDTVRAPDVAFVSSARLPDPLPKKFFAGAPDLAVETVSPDDRPKEIRAKIEDWLRAGTRLVWVVDPAARSVAVHRPGQAPRTLGSADVLDGGEVLPGFQIALASLWRSR